MLDPEKNYLPENVRHIYMMGICGAGMSALAGILKDMGFDVKGSDQNFYPPVSNLLKSLNIPVFKGYRAENIDRLKEIDLVIIGNVIRRDNPELISIYRKEIPYLSFPQAINKLLLKDKKSIVISGTHGKTTTTTLISWILKKAGLDPGLIVGGISKNIGANFMLPSKESRYFVIEGDEYDSSFFDKNPKFFHYNPFILVITGIEYDHADIYKSLEQIVLNFRRLIRNVPKEGAIVFNRENSLCLWESIKAKSRRISYGLNQDANFFIKNSWSEKGRTYFEVYKGSKRYMTFSTSLYGSHNLLNMLAAIAVADFLRIDPKITRDAISEFKGVSKRLDHIGERNGILIIDDFAHHPTAVKETIRAVKERFPNRRVIAIFEPRSNSSRRNVFQKRYSFSFDYADMVLVPEPTMMENISENERFSSKLLVEDLKNRGIEAYYFSDRLDILSFLKMNLKPGDIALFMSNGIFDNLPHRLLGEISYRQRP